MISRNEFSDAYIASELFDHMVRPRPICIWRKVAGSDTTANTLTYLLHELSRPHNLHLQHHLHTELLSSDSASLSDLDKLPFLDSIVREGLRIFSAIPFLEPRQVPSGGRLLHNYFLPENVTLAQGELILDNCRNTSVYPAPWWIRFPWRLQVRSRSLEEFRWGDFETDESLLLGFWKWTTGVYCRAFGMVRDENCGCWDL